MLFILVFRMFSLWKGLVFVMGRNKKENPKKEVLQVRCSSDDIDVMTRAAERLGLSLSSYVRGNMISASLLILGEKGK